ncbi:MAG: hypothetical protein RBR37_07585, partial [Advenella sp.]|nr:hypothetical protein [Advenella sp.]
FNYFFWRRLARPSSRKAFKSICIFRTARKSAGDSIRLGVVLTPGMDVRSVGSTLVIGAGAVVGAGAGVASGSDAFSVRLAKGSTVLLCFRIRANAFCKTA